MPKPAHVEAFEFISEGTQNEIRDYIAFGLFMRSEDEWASGWIGHRPTTIIKNITKLY